MFDQNLPDQLASRLANDRIAIFLFHGVIRKQIDPVRNYTGKHIESNLFSECMEMLLRKGNPLSMEKIRVLCEENEPFPSNSFAVTFDDGFENNISVAAPILQDLKIPFTIYVTSKFVDENGMSWIDRIEYSVQDTDLKIIRAEWLKLDFELNTAKQKIEFLRSIRQFVKNTPSCDPNKFADKLCSRLGKHGKLSTMDQLDLKMSWDQVRTANKNDLITIGGHSHSHPILSFLTQGQLRSELDTSLNMLWRNANVGPTHYSYPEGLAHCFSDNVIKELKIRGVKCCPTAIDGVNEIGVDPFYLKRIMVNAE